MSKKYLKRQNAPTVAIFIIWCVVIYLIFASNTIPSFENLQSKVSELNTKDGLVMILMPVLILVLAGIISPSLKAVLVFWRIKHPLPGCRAFTELARLDDRIDMVTVENKIGNLPTEPREQNIAWYKIFKKYADRVTVEKSHKAFLLARDLASISLVFSILGAVGLCIEGCPYKILLVYVCVMLAQYFALAIVARHHGNRLVCNVLAEYTLES